MTCRDSLLKDLSPFCDIGERGPSISEKDNKLTAKFVRDGRAFKVIVDEATGRVQITVASNSPRYFSSLTQALATELFANLRRWADSQRDFLMRDAVASKDLIPVRGRRHDHENVNSIEDVDALIGQPRQAKDAAEVLLLDGPGGIGKTTLIEQIALMRAESYRTTGKPLLLHVKSRGRVLSNLQDLMAFSLQTLRLAITYDQVPILVKHGLIVLAIDGFDELGDPSGYELAWGQINDLVSSVRGGGTIVLSGRDTLIGRDRLMRDVKALRNDRDIVTEIALDAPSPEQAKEWLKRTSLWTDASFQLPAVAVLLEPESYALRPVFLRLLRDQIKPKELKDKSENDLAALLVNHMIDRESTKFGDAVETAMTKPKIRLFVEAFLKEVARDMADSQSESLDANALVWIAEAALGDGWPHEIQGLIKNRAQVVAFLADDERPGHKKFSHIQIMNYFLGHSTLDAVSNGDFPKYVRRNIIGKEFLSTFADIMQERSGADDPKVGKFLVEGSRFLTSSSQADRGVRNIGALLATALPSFSGTEGLALGGFHADEVLIKGTAPPAVMRNVVINQFDIRGADLSAVEFDSVSVIRMVSDENSRVPASFPNVTTMVGADGRDVDDEQAISALIDKLGRRVDDEYFGNSAVPVKLHDHESVKLLGRACRLRQYWLRSEGDQHAARIVNDPWWDVVANALRNHGFLREEEGKQASGRSSTFYHIRQPDRLLEASRDDADVVAVYSQIATELKL